MSRPGAGPTLLLLPWVMGWGEPKPPQPLSQDAQELGSILNLKKGHEDTLGKMEEIS